MDLEALNLKIILIFTIGFGFASILGYFAHRIKLSPIVGYIVAGYLIGPYSPGYEADLQTAEQLAEIGVVLMMFGVGLHFKWQDLMNVRNIAVTGAFGQTTVTVFFSAALLYYMGWTIQAGVIFGVAIGVASTVVLIRVLTDNNILHTPQGHIAVGWLVVEDIITVIALVLVPTLAASHQGSVFEIQPIFIAILTVLGKFLLMILLLFTLVRKVVALTLSKVVETKSHELFTLTILALTFVIATGSMYLFGTSIALGAFFAGMLVGQTDLHRQVAQNALPLKDTFVVIFFLAIGMLFNPMAIYENFVLFLIVLTIILVVKPVTAFLITIAMRHPKQTAWTLALALAQIGEFSFILAEESNKFHILPDEGFDIIVACSLISISINQGLFKLHNYLEQ